MTKEGLIKFIQGRIEVCHLDIRHAERTGDTSKGLVFAGRVRELELLLKVVAMQELNDVVSAQLQYIIWSPEGRTPPRVRFDTRAAAQSEAERLAAQCPGQQFYVCALVSVSKTTSVQTEQLDGVSGDSVGVRL